MLHSSCLSAPASISSSVTRMIKTSLKHLSRPEHGGKQWAGEVEAKGNRAHLVFCFSNISHFSSLVSRTSTVKSMLTSPVCCQSCTMIQHQLLVRGSDDIILTATMHYASNSISSEWSSVVFNEFSMCICACVFLFCSQESH